MRRAVAIVDGEHYPPVVRHALEELEDLVVAAVFVGGTEKLRGGEDYGVPLEPSIESAVLEHAPEVVLDLSDEPVLPPTGSRSRAECSRWACRTRGRTSGSSRRASSPSACRRLR
jgi:predicted GTPase